MIISTVDNNNMIGLRWRDKHNQRCEKTVSYDDAPPYFYIGSSEREIKSINIRDYGNSFTINLIYDTDGSTSLDGLPLKKVTWIPAKPGYMHTLRKEWDKTYEADVAYHYRYTIDNIIEIPEYKLRKWYWDLEWQQGGEHNDAITCISLYDNYLDLSVVFYWTPNGLTAKDKSNHYVHFNSEKEMLSHFLSLVDTQDPDMLIAWFGSKFDLPVLIKRLHCNGLDPRKLSPYNAVKGVYFNDGIKLSKNVDKYSPVEQPVRGRLILNLDLAFERQWNDAQRGTLPSLALDYVSEIVLGEKKLVSEKFPDKNEFFHRAWLEDLDTYLEYAMKDVELIVRIDEENYTSEAVLALQRLIKAPFDACFYASNMGGIYFMRNASWKAPTGEHGDKVEYSGAMIYDPAEEGTNGLHLGVAAFDFAGLYPSMMIARNISWETKSFEKTDFGVNIATPRDFSMTEEQDMRYYNTDELGLLPKAVLELKELRNEYKKNMKASTSPEEYTKWNNNQMAVKRLMASFYGVVGYQGFGWADIDLAASITASAREAIRCAAFKVMEL
jgi:DNA polymerase I